MKSTKEKLIELLEKSSGEYLSGNSIAESLGITRAAIWKNIKQLENEGYVIEAVTNKGYRLDPNSDVVTYQNVAAFLKETDFPRMTDGSYSMEVLDTVTSTNTILKEKAGELPDWYVAVAGSQSAGRGRTGRSFFSPKGSGVYLSVLLRPDIPVTDSGKLTTAAAVAACRAIETCTDAQPEIKWVNDVFVNGRKVCGILTEASVNFETGRPDWIVTGIGFNVYQPENGFPADLKDIAGAIALQRQNHLRAKLAAGFIDNFYRICTSLSAVDLHKEYKRRCFIVGKPIYILRGEERIPAMALDIDRDFGLKVEYEDGRKEILSAGEVSIRPGSE